MKFKKGKALSRFPSFMSKDIDKTMFTVLSVHANKKFEDPVYFYLNVSLCHSQHGGPELQNICRIGYFANKFFNDNVQSISLFINNISRSLNITAKDSEGNILEDFEGEMTVQIEGCKDTF